MDYFDLTMESFDSTQILDLVGIYISNTIRRILNLSQTGRYRNDGLIYISNGNDPKTFRLQKKIMRAFKFLRFRIEIFNLKIVKYQDVTFK